MQKNTNVDAGLLKAIEDLLPGALTAVNEYA